MRFRLLPRDRILLPGCLIVLVGLFVAVSPGRPLALLDATVLDWLGNQFHGLVGGALTKVYRATGVGFTAVLVAMALSYLVLRRWWTDLRLLVMATGGILILVDLVFKPLFSRNRPPGSLLPLDGHSFPSGHAAGAVAFYFAMVVILGSHHPRVRRLLMVGACLLVGLVWLSTLYVRAHWPTDLLAGAAVGLAWLTVCLAFWREPVAADLQSGAVRPLRSLDDRPAQLRPGRSEGP
ncbi:phosphatase PAP2 family protein [Synechococcus sp. CS-1332]|uniref:phosphatase PAP2 family protein n=1 Tax=Synechococcus sp. CS-1332 TaxID=2847972 RepID=UPI00223B7F82|nr:phosphatase PAP2 family protein [Synechococcus sp. CS-1332]MCT0208329.1 phosphatase PAP2 family protein [Synechococcus sp. CS-1332]